VLTSREEHGLAATAVFYPKPHRIIPRRGFHEANVTAMRGNVNGSEVSRFSLNY